MYTPRTERGGKEPLGNWREKKEKQRNEGMNTDSEDENDDSESDFGPNDAINSVFHHAIGVNHANDLVRKELGVEEGWL